MEWVKYALINLVETLLRAFPFPCKTGLVKIGNPDKNSPVFLTGNFHLTVERVKRALEGIDCYLLVANSHGINVWCGAAGGHLNNHSVISVLKTSGIDRLVNHRKIILPQLAATGIEKKVIAAKTGWHIVWGPVYARDIPEFLQNSWKKTVEMRQVKFPLSQRLEMALMWAFPFSVIVGVLTLFIWRAHLWQLVGLIWGLSLFVFLLFPLYAKFLPSRKDRLKAGKFTVVFDLGRAPLFFWVLFLIGLTIYSGLVHRFSWQLLLHWGFASLVVILLLSMDLLGSTPLFKSGLHEDRLLTVVLDEDRCRGAGFCEQVCPKNCFEMDWARKKTTIPRPDACVQCGACIVQCPFDALFFQSPDGKFISPETIRKYKLNLLGTRGVLE